MKVRIETVREDDSPLTFVRIFRTESTQAGIWYCSHTPVADMKELIEQLQDWVTRREEA